jgi:hypothetical protein
MNKVFIGTFVQAALKVETAIRGTKDGRLNDLQMMGVFRHTGCNESLNNLHIKVSVFHMLSFLEIKLLMFFSLIWFYHSLSKLDPD